MKNKILVSFYVDCGSMGDLDGMFITTKELVEEIIGKTVYFGEILGKHSEVSLVMNREYFEIKTEDQDFLTKLEDLVGSDLGGINPFNYHAEGNEE